MTLRRESPPPRIETDRLVLRRWAFDDALRLREAVVASLEHLRPWMSWALSEPSPIEQAEEPSAPV